jgi:hypothetical protein
VKKWDLISLLKIMTDLENSRPKLIKKIIFSRKKIMHSMEIVNSIKILNRENKTHFLQINAIS